MIAKQDVLRSRGVGELESEDQDGSKGYEKFSSQETREGFCASQDGYVPSDSKNSAGCTIDADSSSPFFLFEVVKSEN